jgi:FkbM family methyltransferase
MKNFVLACLQYYVRYFPINKGKNRLIQFVWNSFSTSELQRITRLRQAPILMECDLSKHIQRDFFFWGTYHYEKELLALWLKYAKDAQTIFDVGANVGVYSLYAASVNVCAAVHAFEPTQELAKKLVSHAHLNDFRNITVNQFAIGKFDDAGFVHICKGDDGENEGMNYVTAESSRLCQPVLIRSLDSYCAEHSISRIDLLKMDIEGGEYHALQGMDRLLSNKVIKCMFLELVEWTAIRYGHSTANIKELLFSKGYQLYEIKSDVLHPINQQGIHHGESNIIVFAETPRVLSI